MMRRSGSLGDAVSLLGSGELGEGGEEVGVCEGVWVEGGGEGEMEVVAESSALIKSWVMS